MSNRKMVDEESCDVQGPYFIRSGKSPRELEENINEVLRRWPGADWEFLDRWNEGECYYREFLRLPQPDELVEYGAPTVRFWGEWEDEDDYDD